MKYEVTEDIEWEIELPEDDLKEVTDSIVSYWLEDYTLEELFEEFDVSPQEAFFEVVLSGRISKESLSNYLSSDS